MFITIALVALLLYVVADIVITIWRIKTIKEIGETVKKIDETLHADKQDPDLTLKGEARYGEARYDEDTYSK